MKHLDIRVTGTVQGVFFRVSTQRAANDRGVTGTVRNEPDGSVFIEAEGHDRALDDFVAWCRRGPANAVVREVRATEGEVQGHRTFEITG
ncbi:MAG TPA: acylphosphatase [bacterium]|nr:acylphosphatase [bacterium]